MSFSAIKISTEQPLKNAKCSLSMSSNLIGDDLNHDVVYETRD
jgi:hypothetical protein